MSILGSCSSPWVENWGHHPGTRGTCDQLFLLTYGLLKKTAFIYRLVADCRPTRNRQASDSLPVGLNFNYIVQQ